LKNDASPRILSQREEELDRDVTAIVDRCKTICDLNTSRVFLIKLFRRCELLPEWVYVDLLKKGREAVASGKGPYAL
jgi:hypothetical protein